MMKKSGIILEYFVTGIGFGAISYLCILTFLNPGVAPTVTGVVSVFILSGLIGLLSMIFKTDISLLSAILIHLIGTFIIFIIMALINHWMISFSLVGLFFLIYVIIWLILIFEQKRVVQKLNEGIKIRKQRKDK